MSRRLVDGKRPTPPKGANPGGAPSVIEINPEIAQRIINSIRMGNYIAIAARQFGVHPMTIHRWLAKGIEDPTSIYGAFSRSVDQALAESEARDLASIDSHANGRPAQYERYPQGHAKAGQLVLVKGKPVKLADEIKSDWKAAMAKLERRSRRRWGVSDLTQTAPEQELPVDVTPKDITPEHKQLVIKDTREVLEALDELESE